MQLSQGITINYFVFAQEALWLDSKASQMGNVKLHAVLHEKFGAEEFVEFYQHGTLHFDEKVRYLDSQIIYLPVSFKVSIYFRFIFLLFSFSARLLWATPP